jgi:L-lysine exporter family protein LysE/ArgO
MLIVLAVSGVSLLLANQPGRQRGLGFAGVLFLLYMGWGTWPKRPAEAISTANATDRKTAAAGAQTDTVWTARRQVAFALSVSLLNPHALLDTIGVIGVAALQFPAPADRLLFTAACIGVSWLWFAALATAGLLLRRSDPAGRTGVWLARGSAVLMWLIAARLGWSLLAR